MLYSESYGSFLHFLSGRRGMEITVLLLLTVPLTAASPPGLTRRSDADAVLPGDTVQASGVRRSKDTQGGHAPALRIVPFHSEDKHLDLRSLKHSAAVAVRSRPQRAPRRGCQLGTCQIHNLANTLFNFGKTSGKEPSTKAHDPQGYGR